MDKWYAKQDVLSGVCNLITMKVASDDCELRVAKRAHERLSCATKRTRLCVQQGVASGSVATNKPELVGQHGIAQNNVDQTCQSVLLEQLTHETYDLREVLHRAGVKYTPLLTVPISCQNLSGHCMQGSRWFIGMIDL